VKGGFALRTKTVVVTIVVVGIACIASAAGQAGRVSPHERVDAHIQGADVSITYGRPYMRGRVIMGALVPYGRVWCPGADEATTLTTSKPLRIGNLALNAGSYTLWMVPSADQWMLVVNSATGILHTEYSSRYDLGDVALRKRAVDPPVEQLTFTIENNPTGSGGVIAMVWETTAVSVPFSVVQ